MKILIAILLVSATSFAEETKSPLSHESELGLVLTSGNTDSESVSAKQITAYTWESQNLLKLEGKYLSAKTSGTETAKSWNLGLRYEKGIYENLSAFLGHSIESDRFAGFVQRNHFDVGLKYVFIKTENDELLNETGYRYTFDQKTAGDNGVTHFGRVYFEWTHNWQKTISHKLLVEYLPNFTTSSAYFLNVEPSLSMALNEIFSLKLAYLTKYQNAPQTGKKQTDTVYTTVLAAKF